MACERFREEMDDYLAECLDEGRRGQWREHFLGCSTCRAWALSAEPSLLFIGAATAEPEVDRIERCAVTVTSMIRQEGVRRRLRRRRTPWVAAAAAAVMAISGGALWWGLPGANTTQPAMSAPMVATEQAPPPEVDVEMSGEGIRVYRLIDKESNETAVCFVVNPALEL